MSEQKLSKQDLLKLVGINYDENEKKGQLERKKQYLLQLRERLNQRKNENVIIDEKTLSQLQEEDIDWLIVEFEKKIIAEEKTNNFIPEIYEEKIEQMAKRMREEFQFPFFTNVSEDFFEDGRGQCSCETTQNNESEKTECCHNEQKEECDTYCESLEEKNNKYEELKALLQKDKEQNIYAKLFLDENFKHKNIILLGVIANALLAQNKPIDNHFLHYLGLEQLLKLANEEYEEKDLIWKNGLLGYLVNNVKYDGEKLDQTYEFFHNKNIERLKQYTEMEKIDNCYCCEDFYNLFKYKNLQINRKRDRVFLVVNDKVLVDKNISNLNEKDKLMLEAAEKIVNEDVEKMASPLDIIFNGRLI